MKHITLVATDFDDTLCLTEKVTFHMENEIVTEMGYPAMTHLAHKRDWGRPLELAIADRVPGIDVREFLNRFALKMPEYVKNGRIDTIPEENLATLGELKEVGKNIVVVTSRSAIEAQHLLDPHSKLTNLVDAFYHGGNSDYMKPDPRVFDKVMSQFQIHPRDAVYIGDAVTDGISANGAGMHFIAVMESGVHRTSDFADVKVDHFVKKFSDILDILI